MVLLLAKRDALRHVGDEPFAAVEFGERVQGRIEGAESRGTYRAR